LNLRLRPSACWQQNPQLARRRGDLRRQRADIVAVGVGIDVWRLHPHGPRAFGADLDEVDVGAYEAVAEQLAADVTGEDL